MFTIAALSAYKVNDLNSKLQLAENNSVVNSKLSTLTIATFEKRVNKNKGISFIYLGNGQCSDCSVFSPILLRSLRKKRMLEYIFYVDAEQLHKDKNNWLKFKRKYDFDQTPCLMLFKDGNRISKLEWNIKEGISEKKLSRWLNNNYQIIRLTSF